MSLFGANNNNTTPSDNAHAAEANIWVAASDGDIDRVQHLISSGAYEVNAQDDHGYTALHAASSYGHVQLIRFLLQHGADPNIQDKDGDTPLHSCECPECATVLVGAGATLTSRNHEGLIPIQVVFNDVGTETETVQTLKRMHESEGIDVPPLEVDEEDGDEDAVQFNISFVDR